MSSKEWSRAVHEATLRRFHHSDFRHVATDLRRVGHVLKRLRKAWEYGDGNGRLTLREYEEAAGVDRPSSVVEAIQKDLGRALDEMHDEAEVILAAISGASLVGIWSDSLRVAQAERNAWINVNHRIQRHPLDRLRDRCFAWASELEKREKRWPSYDVFVSHESHAAPLAGRIADLCVKAGLRPYLAFRRLQVGDKWSPCLHDALTASTESIVLFTPPALASDWVRHEWMIALGQRKRVNPVLHNCEPNQLPHELLDFQAFSFRRIDQVVRSVAHRLVRS